MTIRRHPLGLDFGRRQRLLKEAFGSVKVSFLAQPRVDEVAVFVNSPIEVAPISQLP